MKNNYILCYNWAITYSIYCGSHTLPTNYWLLVVNIHSIVTASLPSTVKGTLRGVMVLLPASLVAITWREGGREGGRGGREGGRGGIER